jgi:hypothetical protein
MKKYLLPFILLLFALLVVSGLAVITTAQAASTDAAVAFLKAVQTNNISKAKGLFVDENRKSLPRGGYDAYFHYESGEDPNLAFLVGQPFKIGTPEVTEHLGDSFCFTPLDCGEAEYVEVPLYFSQATYSPYFLPAELAFSSPYRRYYLEDIQKFIQQSTQQGKNISLQYGDALSLRLRPTLTPFIKEPPPKYISGPLMPNGVPAPSIAVPDETASPVRNAGQVYFSTGQPMSQTELEKLLPRLESITMRFYIQREGKLSSWQVFSFEYKDAVFKTGANPRHE